MEITNLEKEIIYTITIENNNRTERYKRFGYKQWSIWIWDSYDQIYKDDILTDLENLFKKYGTK